MNYWKALIGGLLLLLVGCQDKDDAIAGLDLEGHPVILPRQQTVIVTYWADWCHICKANIPVLNQLQTERYQEVLVLGLNFDEHSSIEQKQAMRAYHLEYPLLQSGEAFHLPVPDHVPTTYVLTPGSHHVYSTFEGVLDLESLKQTVDALTQRAG